MLRFVSRKVPLAAMALSVARFQSSAVVGESAAAAAAARPFPNRRNYRSTQLLPRFEIHDVRDEAAQGSMTRVSVDGKQLLLSQFPQLGPRKADPNDPSPQFDRERRISLRFRHMDLAALVCVVEGRLPSHHMTNSAYELVFEKSPSGYVVKGQVHRTSSQAKEEWSVRFENQFAVTLEHFLQSALTESFGFVEYQHAVAEQARRSTRTGDNNSQSQNQNQNRRRNNNGRRANSSSSSNSKASVEKAAEADDSSIS
ncbi:putative mitochondrial mitochondrial RNA binding protein 1,gBP21, MRP1 [Leptomonas pyrrhocoris]|uniref:Putative mitochondrial mitochondrial RNA binding protein 1,gBP21, MRP1 n=1 Tax=Leptomonas pyrrhocoris TaxID=157538 RepID=A0A0M9G2J1_LEPPY|nr:putative mitochondrial mitochondrial RNA binding protein 1,gBP21, MRP1 [Leptomonas pyrrhocoris]XP_015659372.1 putative mitochondrial mitochondrial RNA binding protein 1,gBP21, MRP1 [Leptomonas pyrrhocoris]XP_015659373.1 putative mitochondrial mitochondrial RNA binding protein 1,gBP21, MRP1 [Leptomonas pyrrhocoris]KPA80932.1 putative mitochondrial mitochondrial RNA binding protein 1,gBP21, MRP1 [Leptomonas pyrrhocoris]KPA80933.1 putative mitochondrial mitochondrial RNA binding protein 1,gBP21|eukprot:XP_015659371.1 putative mitochondrial mitochondrial RNA binding protein 1,gBP21, MRP1 [Leptomonas pyrrhocoris]